MGLYNASQQRSYKNRCFYGPHQRNENMKQKLNLVFIGHVDHGKSTLMGRLLLDTGVVDRRILDRYREEASQMGKATFEFAWVTDTEPEERRRGVTINVRHVEFETPNRHVYLIDAPGHQDFVRNMISGTSEADAAVLVVAADEGIRPQTREHAVLARSFGMEQLVVAVNKMDKVGFSKERYEELRAELESFLQKLGFHSKTLQFVPVSGYGGHNVANRTADMKWYSGPSLVDTIDRLESGGKPIDKPFRMPVDAIYKLGGIGRVFAGVVLSGRIAVGNSVISQPSGSRAEVRSIERFHKSVNEALAGDDIGITLRGEAAGAIQAHEVLSSADAPIHSTREFEARIVILQHPTEIHAGYSPQLHIGTQSVRGTITQLRTKVDPRTGAIVGERPSALRAGDVADVVIIVSRPVALEEAEFLPKLSRFAIRDSGVTIGAGRCLKILAKGDENAGR